jgi:hypothetical protein
VLLCGGTEEKPENNVSYQACAAIFETRTARLEVYLFLVTTYLVFYVVPLSFLTIKFYLPDKFD